MPPPTVEVSVVICTRDRPAQLQRLLESLRNQETTHAHEILVVNNSPDPIAGTIHEPRPGLSFARNAGIRNAKGSVIVFADDDMVAPPNWLATLVKPVLENGHAASIGLTEPMKLDTAAERLFEAYGGHGYSEGSRIFTTAWLAAQRWKLPMWEVGPLGNAAIRRDVFDRIGYFDEALGAGTPVGSWEDFDLTYRLLKTGASIHYEPGAKVRHAHREDIPGLTKQLCAYRRGEVAFCILIAARYRDWRALPHLFLWIPLWRARLLLRECARRVVGQRQFDFAVMAHEAWAYLSAPWALLVSLRRKRKLSNCE